ncbi:prolyl-tRNA synthetase, partial [Candidatus Kaiserbacteria bacterium RIFCSPHIGHO2_02_FULL_49_34]
RQSRLFTRTRHDAPADEVSKNAQLLIRAGFVHKEMAGAYSFLPLGLKTLNKVIGVIREEMDGIGGQEVTLTGLQDPAVWEATGRFDDEVVDVWFKTKLKNDTEIGLGFTHEEPITRMMREHLLSHKDAPKLVYQFQTKFRNETRAKSGIMRTREFIMKDLYSFAKDEEEHLKIYQQVADAYHRIFSRLGIGEDTYQTFASGGVFAKYSHEFQTVTDAGEDVIYVQKSRKLAINQEVNNDEVRADLNVTEGELEAFDASEVGNIFTLGTRFSEALGLMITGEDGEKVPVFMGSYGIGPARVMGVIVEKFSDEKGMVWPDEVAPFKVHLVGLNLEDDAVREYADGVYESLKDNGIDVLYDDRDARPGEKFADSDLMGFPYRVVVSRKTMESGAFEVVTRATGDVRKLSEEELYRDFDSVPE